MKKILEKYYETDAVEKTDIIGAIKERKIFPCMFGSALKLDGVKAFLNLLDEYTVMPSYGDEFGAKVYKIAEDNQATALHL